VENTSLPPSEPDFTRPVIWSIARRSIPELLATIGDNLPFLREALQKAQGSRFDTIDVYLMPEEAAEAWRFFQATRKGIEDAPTIEEGTKGNL
jgi:hypothetical protein